MTVHCQLIKCLFLACLITVDSVPIDYIGDDQNSWQKSFVRQFFVPFYMVPEENKLLHKNDYYNGVVTESYDTLSEQQYGTSILKNHEVESSSRDKQGISDFGASYGFYHVGLAIFSDGVRSNLNNVDIHVENSDISIDDENTHNPK